MNIATLLISLSFLYGCQSDSLKIAGLQFEEKKLDLKSGESGLTFSDLNGDHFLDLVTADESHGTISIFLGNGKGELRKHQELDAGENPGYVSTADFNEDSSLDLVIANHETTYLTIFLGDGQGGFERPENSRLEVNVGPHPHVVKTTDLDRDGHMDIIVDHRQGEGLLVLLGNGIGGFDTPGILISTGGDPYRGFAIGDLNGDSIEDFVSPNTMGLGVVFNSANSDLPEKVVEIPSLSPFAVEIGDMNGDGRLDIIAASEGAQPSVQVYFQDESSFSKSNQTSFNLRDGAKQVAIGDLNGDEISDAVVSTWSSEILVLIGQKNGLMRQDLIQIDYNPWGIAIGDLNGDGRDDFIIGDGAGAEASIFISK